MAATVKLSNFQSNPSGDYPRLDTREPGFGIPETLLRNGIASTRVYGVARAIQLRAPLGRDDLAREIVSAATGTARELMNAYAAREPHPHVTAADQRLAARFENAVHGVAQLLHDLPDLLWDETLDLITNGYSDRACALILDLHGHITASLDRFGRNGERLFDAAD